MPLIILFFTMKNSMLLPLLVVTASAAFGLGWVARPGGDSGADASDERMSVKTGTRVASASRQGGSDQARAEDDFVKRFLVGGKISAEDMKAAIEEMADVNDPLLRQKMLAALLENLTAENALVAFQALRENRRGGPFGRGGDA